MKKRSGIYVLLAVLFLTLAGMGGTLSAHAAGWKFGSQLKGREKELYELLEEKYSALKNYKKVNGINVKFRGSITEKEFQSLEWTRVQQAFCLDHSELFWISSLGIDTIATRDRPTGPFSSLEAVVYLVDWYPDIRKDVSSAQKEIKKAVAAVKKHSGRYAKVKAAHDYVIKLTSYPRNVMPTYYHAVTGPLLGKYSHQGVCEAYAWLFDIICDASGIPCIVLEGNDHAWNYVQMDDGKWYLVDTTWDDAGGISYDYFLVGSDTYARGKKVKQSHPASSTKDLYRMVNVAPLKYPTLSKKAYEKSSSQTKKVSSVKIKSTTKQVKAGKKLTLKATVLPSNAANKKLKWSSSNTKYATVTSKGVVKTKKAGKGKTVKITAKAADGSGKKATIRIKIK